MCRQRSVTKAVWFVGKLEERVPRWTSGTHPFLQHCTTCVSLILNMPRTYLHVPEKRNKLCLFCRLNLFNFSSLGREGGNASTKMRDYVFTITFHLSYLHTSFWSPEVMPMGALGSALYVSIQWHDVNFLM